MKNIIEKISKLLNLANNSAATQGEIENAMAAAKKIARQNDIDIASVEVKSDNGKKGLGSIEVERDSTLRTKSRYEQPYHRYIYQILDKVFGVQVIRSWHNDGGGVVISAIHLIGTPTDVVIAKLVFPFLQKLFPKTLSRLVSAGTLTYNAADTNGFNYGLMTGIIDANKAEEEALPEVEKNLYAMVVVKKEEAITAKVEEEFPNAKAKKGRAQKFDATAAALGKVEGSKINLKQL